MVGKMLAMLPHSKELGEEIVFLNQATFPKGIKFVDLKKYCSKGFGWSKHVPTKKVGTMMHIIPWVVKTIKFF